MASHMQEVDVKMRLRNMQSCQLRNLTRAFAAIMHKVIPLYTVVPARSDSDLMFVYKVIRD